MEHSPLVRVASEEADRHPLDLSCELIAKEADRERAHQVARLKRLEQRPNVPLPTGGQPIIVFWML